MGKVAKAAAAAPPKKKAKKEAASSSAASASLLEVSAGNAAYVAEVQLWFDTIMGHSAFKGPVHT